MASATVALSCSAMYSVFIMPPAVSSSNSSSSRTSDSGATSISSRISSEVSSSSSAQHVGGFVRRHLLHDLGRFLRLQRFQNAGLHLGIDLGQRVGRHLAVDGLENRFALGRAQFFDDVRQVGRMHLLQLLVRNVQAQPPLRIGSTMLQNSQRMEFGGIGLLQPADPARRQHALHQPPENAADADVHLEDIQQSSTVPVDPVAVSIAVRVTDLEGDVVDAHHLAAVHVDDLLVEQIAADAQHVLVGMIRREHARR